MAKLRKATTKGEAVVGPERLALGGWPSNISWHYLKN